MGLPTGFESLLWFMGQILIIRMLNMSDPLFVGITSLVGSVQIFALFVYLGFSRAGMILVGRHWGEGNRTEAVRTGLLCQKMSLAVSITWGLVLFFFGAAIATIFTDKVEIIAASGFVMRIAAFSISFQALNVTAGAAIRGTGDTHWMLYSQIFGTAFVIFVSYLLIVRYDWGLTGMYLTVAADELFRGVFNLARFVSGVNPLRLALRMVRVDTQ
jgi:Na+-driven multidrug efflux pump